MTIDEFLATAEAREVPAPVIVVEVLSPSTEWRDVHRKLIGYF